jgi:hypothetical protein
MNLRNFLYSPSTGSKCRVTSYKTALLIFISFPREPTTGLHLRTYEFPPHTNSTFVRLNDKVDRCARWKWFRKRSAMLRRWLYDDCTYYMLVYIPTGSSACITTDYGLDGPGIESRWGRDFSHTSRPALGPTQPPVQWIPGLSRGKAAGAWCWSPSPF